MIEVQDLSKSVEGNVIFADITFRVDSGDHLALMGANGSGKSLLLRILATLTKPTSGAVKIAGHDAFSNLREVRPLIGYIPETFDGYPHLSIVEYLEFFAAAYQLDKSGRATAIEDVLNLMDIAAIAHRKIGSISKGEKQRLCLAKTFLHDPVIWLFDEPLSGLDVRGRLELSTLIQELSAMDKTVVTATNRPGDVAPICTHAVILAEGGVAFSDSIAETKMNLEDLFLQVTTLDRAVEESDEPDAPINTSDEGTV